MLKKIIKTGVVMSLLLASVNVFAQNTGKPEYPRYGFWSNWFVGGSLDLNHDLYQGPLSFGDGWRISTNMGMDIFLQQKLNHAFDWRLRFGMPSFGKPRAINNDFPTGEGYYDVKGDVMTRHYSLTLDVMFSINDALLGYDPDRRGSIYAIVGFGVAFNGLHSWERQNYRNYGIGSPMLVLGLGASYRISDAQKIFCEYSFDNSDIPHFPTLPFYKWHDVNTIFRLGYAYGFGITATDQAIAAQKAMLTQENFGALNTQVNNLERQVTTSRNNEKKLESRIAELEDQLAQALAQGGQGGNSAAADSLQAVIDQIKADQLNFYAMPFSVLYGVDEWQVSESEAIKVKAVARVLKDNPDVKILVVGFADYTGSDNYNMKLSEKRANEVKRLLVKKYGIDESRIETEYKGKSVAFGDIQYSLNRRVSFYRVIE